MKTRIQSIIWALILGLAFGFTMNSCQKETFLDIQPATADVQQDLQSDFSHEGASFEGLQPFISPFKKEVLNEEAASSSVLPIVLRVKCRIIAIEHRPDKRVQVYTCKGVDELTQSPVEIKGKRMKNYLTGESQNKGSIVYPNGTIRMEQVGSALESDVYFNLRGQTGAMAGGKGTAIWKDPTNWFTDVSLFEGTLLQ